MLLFALALSLVAGILFGLFGGGGSILMVPILSTVAGMPPKTAIASSLVVVGMTSTAAAIAHARAGRVRWRLALVLGAGGMIGAFVGGHLAAGLSPGLLMFLFVLVMIATAIAMMRPRREARAHRDLPTWFALAIGVAIGVVAGTVGAGGGFLVMPALVLVGDLRTDSAVGTALVVIALQSAAGAIGHLGHVAIDLPLTLAIAAAAIAGSVIGGRMIAHVAPAALRRGFGVLVALVAVVTLVHQIV